MCTFLFHFFFFTTRSRNPFGEFSRIRFLADPGDVKNPTSASGGYTGRNRRLNVSFTKPACESKTFAKRSVKTDDLRVYREAAFNNNNIVITNRVSCFSRLITIFLFFFFITRGSETPMNSRASTSHPRNEQYATDANPDT